VDGTYVGEEVFILQNTGAGQRRVPSAYVGATRTATVAAWAVVPDSTSVVEIAPLKLTLATGKGAQYTDPATSGKQEFFRIGDEEIRYTAKSGDVLSWTDGTYRAQHGTVREDHKVNDVVVLRRAWIDKPAKEVIEDILNEAGLLPAHLFLPGTAGNYASTPDSAAVSITGDIDIRVGVSATDVTDNQMLICKYVGGTGDQGPYLQLVGLIPFFGYSIASGSQRDIQATANLSWSNGDILYIRATLDIDNGAGGHDVRFYTSSDRVSWTQLGSTVTGSGTEAQWDNAAPWQISGYNNGTVAPFDGKVYYAELRNGIDGPVVAAFDPSRADADATTFVAETGETWTINQSGSPAAEIRDNHIDLAGLATEDTNWLSGARITASFDPEQASTLLAELLRDLLMMCWWHPVEQKVKFKVDMPELLASVTLIDTNKLMLDKTGTARLDTERITQSWIDFNLRSATADEKKRQSYQNIRGIIDAVAESANGYGDARPSLPRSRWFTAANELLAGSNAARRLARLRDAPSKITFHLDPLHEVALGQLVDVATPRLTDAAGNAKTVRCRIVKLTDLGGHLEAEAQTTIFARRYAFICPNGYPNYPSATADQRQRAFISNGATMSDGTSAYLIS
jgi:hypothetical protein